MKSLCILIFLLFFISKVSGVDYQMPNDSLVLIRTLAEAKAKKDEGVAIELFKCDSCFDYFGLKGGTERRTFYNSEGFLIAIHECHVNGAFDRVENYFYDEFGNQVRHEYLDQNTGYKNANGKIRRDTSWIYWGSTNDDTIYNELDYSINKIVPDEYTNSRIKRSVRNKFDSSGMIVEKIETTHSESDTIPNRRITFQGPENKRNEYEVDSTFRWTIGENRITHYSYNEKGNRIKEVETFMYGVLTTIQNYIIDSNSKSVISEKIKSEISDTVKLIRTNDLSYSDGKVVVQRDSIGTKYFNSTLSWTVTENRKKYRKNRIVKEEYWEIYQDSNSLKSTVINRYDRFGNKVFLKSWGGQKKKYYRIMRWKYTRDTLLVKSSSYAEYFVEATQRDTGRMEFQLVNKYSRLGKLIYSKQMNMAFSLGMGGNGSKLPLKGKTFFTKLETIYYPDSIVEEKMEYGKNNIYISRTKSLFTANRDWIKSEEVDVMTNDRFVKERIVVDDNKYMITEKLNGVLLNNYVYEVLRYSTR